MYDVMTKTHPIFLFLFEKKKLSVLNSLYKTYLFLSFNPTLRPQQQCGWLAALTNPTNPFPNLSKIPHISNYHYISLGFSLYLPTYVSPYLPLRFHVPHTIQTKHTL